MKYLQDYMAEGQTKAFNKAGAFFAFSNKQFNEAKKEGVKYASLGGGLICPKENCEELIKSLDDIYKSSIKQDLKENTKIGVIRRELNNHEADYTGDIGSTFEAISDYGITEKEILKVFRNKKLTTI